MSKGGTMKILSVTNAICFMIAAICLAAGYVWGGYWLIFPAFLAMILFWLVMKRKSFFGTASSLLLVYVFLAVVGVITNLPLPLIVAGSTAALASWDLTIFNHSMSGNRPVELNGPLGKYHMQSLAVMLVASLLLTLISLYLNLQFSFGITVFLVLAAMGCLSYSLQYIIRNR